jgi:hypothetical protein
MITIIVGDETGLRKLNEVFLLPAQILQRKILIEKFEVLMKLNGFGIKCLLALNLRVLK